MHVGEPVVEGDDVLEPAGRRPDLGPAEVTVPPASLGRWQGSGEAVPPWDSHQEALLRRAPEHRVQIAAEVLPLCLEDRARPVAGFGAQLPPVADFQDPAPHTLGVEGLVEVGADPGQDPRAGPVHRLLEAGQQPGPAGDDAVSAVGGHQGAAVVHAVSGAQGDVAVR